MPLPWIKRGLVWCSNGINNGLYRYNPETGVVKNFRNKPGDETSLSSDRVTKLLVDHQGRLWVGTWGGGLCRFVPGSDTFIRHPYTENPGRDNNKSDLLDNPNVISLFEDRQVSFGSAQMPAASTAFIRLPAPLPLTLTRPMDSKL